MIMPENLGSEFKLASPSPVKLLEYCENLMNGLAFLVLSYQSVRRYQLILSSWQWHIRLQQTEGIYPMPGLLRIFLETVMKNGITLQNQ